MDNGNKQTKEEQTIPFREKVYWHDGMFDGLQLELHDYRDSLNFEDEHQLSKEALIMDVLIIKKTADVRIDKNIGWIFKRHNIVEYKSESDNLSIWDYHKVDGYAMIYSAFNKVPIDDITVNFVVTPKPTKLLGYLRDDRGFEVDEVRPGIYYVKGDTFAVQIIETKKLDASENPFLRYLRNNLTKQDILAVFRAYKKYRTLDKIGPFLNTIMDANALVVREVMEMRDETVRFLLSGLVENGKLMKFLEEDGTLARVRVDGEEKKARDTALEMLRDGFTPEKIARYVKMPIEWVKGLATQSLTN